MKVPLGPQLPFVHREPLAAPGCFPEQVCRRLTRMGVSYTLVIELILILPRRRWGDGSAVKHCGASTKSGVEIPKPTEEPGGRSSLPGTPVHVGQG